MASLAFVHMVVGVRLRSMHVAQNEKLSTIEAGEYAYNILHHGNEGSIMLGKVSRETLHTLLARTSALRGV